MSFPNPSPRSSPRLNATVSSNLGSSNNKYPRRGHRRKISALRLSSDTTSSLPEYIPAAGWPNQQHGYHHQKASSSPNINLGDGFGVGTEIGEEEDRPPDYPDSAEEADEDTDTDNNNVIYLPLSTNQPLASPYQRPQTASPRRSKRSFPIHKRKYSTQNANISDPYLDSLLERSVHALEMSNTLLQSSISTKNSLSTILSSDSQADGFLEARALGLSSRIRNTWEAKSTWANDLEDIRRDVEGLLMEGSRNVSPTPSQGKRGTLGRNLHMEGGSVSSSLPTTSPLSSMQRGLTSRRPSLELRQQTDRVGVTPRLHYSQQNRANLVSPPPRPLTQYLVPTEDTETISLPPTLGLRSPSSHQDKTSPSASSSTTSLLLNPNHSFTASLPPKLTDKPVEPSTPAYNMLSSLYRSQTPSQPIASSASTPSSSFTVSFMPRRRGSSTASNASTERGMTKSRRRSSSSPVAHKSPDRRYGSLDRHSSVTTPIRGVSPLSASKRPMTPPTEEPSSSSSEGYVPTLTVQSLRKILDEQPPAPDPGSAGPSVNGKQKLRAPAFMPRSPPPVADFGTSTATASISRLFTKGKHSSSTRASSPPRQSAMKRSSATSTATHSPVPSISVSSPLFASTSAIPSTSSTPAVPSSPSASPNLNTPLSIPELVTKVLSKSNGQSPLSSGQSTPSSAKRISFAELPESYASTRPASSRFSKGSKPGKGKKGKGKKNDSAEEVSSNTWWGSWLGPVGGGTSGLHGLGVSLARQEERMEDRTTRSWAGRMSTGFGGGLDEWAV